MDQPRSVFESMAGAYDLATSQPYWDDAAGRLLDAVGPVPAEARVLDLGCGPGTGTLALARRLGPGCRVTGVDCAPTMIRRAVDRQRHQRPAAGTVLFRVCRAESLPFPDGAFDLVTGHSFLYLVHDPTPVMAEVRRVLAPGGALALMEPDGRGTLWAAAWQARARAWHLLVHPWDAGRFAVSMVTWRAYAASRGYRDPDEVRSIVADAGLRQVTLRPTLAGLGMHVTARG